MFIGLVIIYLLIKAASTPGTFSLHAPATPWLISIPLLAMITVILLPLTILARNFKDLGHLKLMKCIHSISLVITALQNKTVPFSRVTIESQI